ncbi:MAG TPA: AAA family ATPase, partial [Thermoanaerobaculia bacterium]|nr:AAA family ATPase [Thermoanaerobaculia bacterium]
MADPTQTTGQPPATASDASELAQPASSAAELAQAAGRLRGRLTASLPGLDAAVDELLAVYIAGGHALLEGVPGIGKTLLARSFAAALGRGFKRLQFTPDLMPADVVGSNVFDPAAGGFHLVHGPVFTEILMADEVNRTPPKTQAALLEAMQERQVTAGQETMKLPEPF